MMKVWWYFLAALLVAAHSVVKAQPAQLDCDLIECPDEAPVCEDGQELRVPLGQCCEVCVDEGFVDCSFVLCLVSKCGANQRLVVPEGECCGTCEPIDRCLGVPCGLPLCTGGLTPTVPEGECCPKCPNCSGIFCIQIACELPLVPVIPPGECCPRCELDCSAVSCLKPVCPIGQVPVVPDGECCPVCQRDCSAVQCLRPICKEGEVLVTPEGECCPKCQKDCSDVDCEIPVCPGGHVICPGGQVAKVPDGECCHVCQCEIAGQTFSDCASACPRTCDNPEVLCKAQCRPGCQCPEGTVLDTQNKKCVPVEECPRSCPIRGQVFQTCAGCPTTCIDVINEEQRICPAVCRVGCACPPGQVIDSINGDCLTPDECPNPCEKFDCGPNARCKLHPPTGEPFCEPSCSLNNGGCEANQECSLQVVQCVRAPCPRVVRCSHTGACRTCRPDQACILETHPCLVPPCPQTALCLEKLCTLPAVVGPCRAAIPRFFFNVNTKQCERFIFGGCRGNENNFETLQECERTCGENSLSPCATIRCRNGFRCEVENGEGFCQPDCSLNNGGCPQNLSCRLQKVECARSPCPLDRQCEDTCARILCDTGSWCKIENGRPFCQPNCSLDNGGCPRNTTCRLKEVECATPPCLQVRVCENPCALIDCAVGFRCEVFNGRGFCRPDCSIANGGCPTGQICELQDVVCVTAPCFPTRVCKPACPPKCSKDLCRGAPKRICSNPGPREIPGCTGSCQLTYCRQCYFNEEAIFPPPGSSCGTCSSPTLYASDSSCYRRWSRCTARAHRKKFGAVNFDSSEQLRCYSPPCPLRG